MVTLFCYFTFRYFDFAKVFTIKDSVFFFTDKAIIKILMAFSYSFLPLCYGKENWETCCSSALSHIQYFLTLYITFSIQSFQNENLEMSGNKIG